MFTRDIAIISRIMVCSVIMLAPLIASGASTDNGSQDSGPLHTILERQRSLLLDRGVPDAATIQGYRKTLQKDGRWPDVDYKSRSRSKWPPNLHLQRIVAMASAYAQAGHALQGDKALLQDIYLALDHWLKNRYESSNWWHNVIAVPRHLGTIGVLINNDLAGDRRKSLLNAMKKCRIGRTGANLMDQAQIVMVRALLSNDTALLSKAVKAIAGEIKVTKGEGLQEDWSFHQHGACSQPLSYGRVYLSVLRDVGWVVRGTPYEFSREKREIVSMFLLNGVQWMTRGIYTAPSTIDRQSSRPNALTNIADYRGHLQKWIEVDPENAPALKAFLGRQNGKVAPLSGFRHYYRSDLSIYQRPGFSLFLKTRSKRVKGTESINGENLIGKHYLHTGDHYIIRDGSEYTALPPVWDWSRLPGLTMCKRSRGVSAQSFVGGLGNGDSGLTVMDYSRDIKVRKLWAFNKDLVVCLLGGWQDAAGKEDLRTTLDQCALKGPVVVNHAGKTVTLKSGFHELPQVRWVLHGGIGYIPLQPSSMAVRMGETSGSWRRINKAASNAVVKEDVFTCDLLHGDSPLAGGFVLAPGSTVETLDQITRKPSYEVLQNDRKLQCIRFEDGTFMAAFYEPGRVTVNKKIVLEVDKPCLALWLGTELTLCDPTNPDEAVPVKAVWQGRKIALELPAGGKVLNISP